MIRCLGSPIRPTVANQIMEEFETMPINITTNPPRLWLRYVDDTFVIQRTKHSIQFLEHFNSIDPHIQFTEETLNTDGSIPFVDTLVSPRPGNALLTTVYGKTTHIDQHLHWDRHHSLSAKFSFFNTLAHRNRTAYVNNQMLHKGHYTWVYIPQIGLQ